MSPSEGVGEGGAVPQRPVCVSPPQNLNVTASVREKKDGSDLEEGVERGFVWPSTDRKDPGRQGG